MNGSRLSLCLLTALAGLLGRCATAPAATSPPQAELFQPGLVSTDDINVRVTFSPNGLRMLWGVIPTGNPNGFEIFESVRMGKGWAEPHPVSFNSPQNDFDPFFAPDGSGVYFFSNRPGGLGKDDLYFVPTDARSNVYGTPVNLGPGVNSPGDEWAPTLSPDGQRLLFSTDGRGGAGKHDLFVATRQGEQWGAVANLVEMNGPDEDFDAAFLADGRSLIFTSGDFEGQVSLCVVRNDGVHYGKRQLAGAEINFPDAWTLGPSITPRDPGFLYFSSKRKGDPAGSNLYRIRFE